MSGERARRGTVHGVLLSCWVALIAADRVDLLGGGGALLLTPFLALTPAVLISELVRRHTMRRPIVLSRDAIAYASLSFALLAVVFASVFASPETSVSAGRAALLLLQLMGSFAVVLVAIDREDLPRILERGAVAGLLIFALFDLLQVAWLLQRVPEYWHAGPATVHLVAYMYGSFVPRLSGMVADQNRAGLVLLLYGWCVSARPGRRPRAGFLALTVLLMLLTISRSVGVSALAAFTVLVLERRVRRVPAGLVLGAALLVAAASATLLVSPRARDAASRALDPLGERFSMGEGSSQVHLTVLGRGVAAATEAPERVALGIGYGSAYTVLQDVFPGSRYGNFHSLYVTMWAESGVLALLLTIVLLAGPMARGGPYRALVVGVAVFNVFYQSTTEPAFWTILAMAWLTMPRRAPLPSHALGTAMDAPA